MKKIKYISLLFLLFFSNLLIAQEKEDLDKEIKKGIDLIYNIKFDEAEKKFKEIMSSYPESPSGRFFLAMIEWWKIALNIWDESRDEKFFAMLEDVIFHCNEKLKKNPNDIEAIFYKGGAIGFRGRLRATRESWIKAANDGREALPLIQLAHKLDPNNYDIYFGLGLYNYYAAVIPDKYPILKPFMIFFPSGDKEKGIQQLELAAEKGKFTSTETKYFLMTIYYDNESNYSRALELINDLRKQYPDNPTFHKYNGRIYIRFGDYYNAAQVFREIINKADNGVYGYNDYLRREAYYYLGLYYRFYSNIDSAIVCYNNSIEISKKIDTVGDESGFQSSAVINLANIYDLMKNRSKAVELYNYALKIKEWNNSHKLAKIFLEKPYGE